MLSISITALVSCNIQPTPGVSPNLPLPPIFEDVHNLSNTPYGSGLPWLYEYAVYRSMRLGWGDTPGYLDYLRASSQETLLDTELPSTPDTITVYRIIPPEDHYEYALDIARRFSLTSEPTQFNSGGLTYYSFDGGLRVWSDGSISYYAGVSQGKPTYLPSREECTQIAQDWLKALALYPENIFRIETGSTTLFEDFMDDDGSMYGGAYQLTTSVYFMIGIDGYELAGAGATVVLGDYGRILEASIKIPELEPYTTAAIKKPEDALALFQSYLENPADFLQDSPAYLINISMRMPIWDISTKYFCMINPDSAQSVYAQPVYFFNARTTINCDAIVDGLMR